MNLMNMLSWWQWSIMAALPPLVVALYFLKLRRVPLEVPSTYLWKRTIEDLHVNSIWQRLRQNLLLWLQLLILAAIILACLRPGVRSQINLESRTIFLIDNSASMQATELGRTRLEEAKRKALEAVDNMSSRDVAMVIAFSDRADVRQSYTQDKRKLRSAIELIQGTNRTTDLTEALRTASGLANPGRTSQIEDVNDVQVAEAVPANLVILSDGGFTAPQFDLGNLSASYVPIGLPSFNNVGIIAFTCQRNEEKPDQVEAFARIQNFGASSQSGDATLTLDGRLIDNTSVTLAAGEIKGVSFEMADVQEGKLELRLNLLDDLMIDNTAYAAIDPPRQLEVVLVTRGNTPIQFALSTPQTKAMASVRVVNPDALAQEEMIKLAASGSVDLFIYDNCSPAKMPEANTLFLGSTPSGDAGAAWSPTEAADPQFVIDINRSHPLIQYVDFGGLLIAEGFSLKLPNGGTELVRTDAGILMAVAPRDAYQDAVVGMRLGDGNTNWPKLRGFPVFLMNCLEVLGGAVSGSGARTVRPGQAMATSLASRFNRVAIQPPLGAPIFVDRGDQSQLVFTQTDQLGSYAIQSAADGRVLQMFAVNIFSEQESNLRPLEAIGIGLEEVDAQPPMQQIARAEYWRWLLVLALVVLLLEGYLYSRRVAV